MSMHVRAVYDPEPGRVITCAAGSKLVLRLGRRGLASRWLVVAAPLNVVPLVSEGHQLELFLFDGVRGELRLERRRGDGTLIERRAVYVDPVSTPAPSEPGEDPLRTASGTPR